MAPTFKLWGPRRTGTNVARVMLETYTNMQAQGGPWKHGLPEDVPPADVHIVHTKHPFAWLLSMERWWGVNPGLERFVRKMHVAWNPRDAVMRAHATRLDAYHALVHGLTVVLPSDSTALVRYEDLLEDPSGLVRSLAEKADAQVTGSPELPSSRVTSQGSEADTSFDPSYYMEQEWVHEFRPDELEALSGYVKECGYGSLFWERLSYDPVT